jgi:hypothetical protein
MITTTPAVGYQTSDAAAFLDLAAIAAMDLTDLYLQPPWKLIDTFQTTSRAGGAQGFVAIGPLPSTSVTVAVVAIGFSWPDFIELYKGSQHARALPPPGLMPVGSGMTDYGYNFFYTGIRKQIWAELLSAQKTVPGFQGGMAVFVTGHGPAAPLAQLAALDLVPKRTWSGQTSPAASLGAYVYSCPAFGDQAFANYYASQVPDGYTVNLQTASGVPVDFYPLAPDASSGYAVAGSVKGGSGRVPDTECPWYERETPWYAAALRAAGPQGVAAHAAGPAAGAPAVPARRALAVGFNLARAQLMPAPAAAASVPSYNPVLAYTLSLLSSVAYQRVEHPDLTMTVPAPYSFVKDIVAGGVAWASVFVAPDTAVVVAFRGTTTWQEMLQVWGSDATAAPPWSTVSGQVLSAYGDLYMALRDGLRQALASVNAANLRLFFTGHCVGGALASLATLDLSLNPATNVAPVAGVYTFGAPPVGTIDFANAFNQRLGAISFQVARPSDVIPQLVFGSALTAVTLGQSITLDGGLQNPDNGSTFHALPVYVSLLNPRTVATAPALAPSFAASVAAPGSAEQAFSDAVAARAVRWDDVHKCLLDTADHDGRLVLGFAQSPVTMVQDDLGRHTVAVQDIVVQPGHELIVNAADAHVVARSLTLGAGARVTVNAPATFRIGALTALPVSADAPQQAPPTVRVVGEDGITGMDGRAGSNGHAGAPGGEGGFGSLGGDGSPGAPGGDAPAADFRIDTIEGVFVVETRGGAGGSGGNGGAGGAGGAAGSGLALRGGDGGRGGAGGAGGNGGNGSVINIVYRQLVPSAQLQVRGEPASGGDGGAGGRGGAGGWGNPSGTSGTSGAQGTPGAGGRPSVVNFMQGAS